jgi:hypothetical protein
MTAPSDQYLSPDATKGVSATAKHWFMRTLRKYLSSNSLSSQKSADTASSNASGSRKQPQVGALFLDRLEDVLTWLAYWRRVLQISTNMPQDASVSALSGTLVSGALGAGYCSRPTLIPLQVSAGKGGLVPYFDGSTEHVRRNHTMCDLSGQMMRAGTTDLPNQPESSILGVWENSVKGRLTGVGH